MSGRVSARASEAGDSVRYAGRAECAGWLRNGSSGDLIYAPPGEALPPGARARSPRPRASSRFRPELFRFHREEDAGTLLRSLWSRTVKVPFLVACNIPFSTCRPILFAADENG